MGYKDFILHSIMTAGKCKKSDVIDKYKISPQLLEITLSNYIYDFAIWDEKGFIYSWNIKNIKEYFLNKES